MIASHQSSHKLKIDLHMTSRSEFVLLLGALDYGFPQQLTQLQATVAQRCTVAVGGAVPGLSFCIISKVVGLLVDYASNSEKSSTARV